VLDTSGNAALKCCNCLHTPHSRGPAPSLWVNDEGRKDHCFDDVQSQLTNHERGSSSVHRRLRFEVGPQTCGKPVVLKIPVKKMFNVKSIIQTMKHALFILYKNQKIRDLEIATCATAANLLTSLSRFNSNLNNPQASIARATCPHYNAKSPDLSFHAQALKMLLV